VECLYVHFTQCFSFLERKVSVRVYEYRNATSLGMSEERRVREGNYHSLPPTKKLNFRENHKQLEF